jgi:hypothetical protein
MNYYKKLHEFNSTNSSQQLKPGYVEFVERSPYNVVDMYLCMLHGHKIWLRLDLRTKRFMLLNVY